MTKQRVILFKPLSFIVLFIISLTIVPIVCAVAQEPMSPGSTLHVQSQIVLLDVIVTDEKGGVVSNLDRDDFSVYENGVQQQIQNFEPPHEQGSAALQPIKDKYGHDHWGETPLTLLVVDALNTPFDEGAFARQQIDRYLKCQPATLKHPTIAFWLDDSGFRALTPFTLDRDTVLQAVDKHKASIPEKYEREAVVEQLSQSLSAIQQIAIFSRSNKGSKDIIWVGRSFPGVNGTILSAEQTKLLQSAISSTIDLLMAARATIYVIDPTLDVAFDSNHISTINAADTIAPFDATDPFANSFSFYELVRQTGGDYLYNRNDLSSEIGESINRGTQFYSLSYVPLTPIQDDKYRKIDIRLRDPHLHVQTREGYYPTPPDAAPTAQDEKDLRFDLREALLTGMKYDSVATRLEQCSLEQVTETIACNLLLDNAALSFASDPSGNQDAPILTVIAALDTKSRLLANNVLQLGIRIPESKYNPSSPGQTRIQLHLRLPKGADSLRIAVRDSSGRIGTISVSPQELIAVRTAAAKKLPSGLVHSDGRRQ